MPPKIQLYTDRKCDRPFKFDLATVKAGESKSIPVWLKNEGDKTVTNLIVNVEAERRLEITTQPSILRSLAPGEKAESSISIVAPDYKIHVRGDYET